MNNVSAARPCQGGKGKPSHVEHAVFSARLPWTLRRFPPNIGRMDRDMVPAQLARGLERAILLAVLAGAPAPSTAEQPDFVRDVKPILAQSCARCHTEGLAQGQLRLDSAAAFRRGGLSGSPVVPGDSASSLLYQRLVHEDPAK